MTPLSLNLALGRNFDTPGEHEDDQDREKSVHLQELAQ